MPDLRVLKASTLRSYIGLITFSAASLAIATGITLSRILVFEYHSNSGVVGWLSVNEYPKQQEYFFLCVGTARHPSDNIPILDRVVCLLTLVRRTNCPADTACIESKRAGIHSVVALLATGLSHQSRCANRLTPTD